MADWFVVTFNGTQIDSLNEKTNKKIE